MEPDWRAEQSHVDYRQIIGNPLWPDACRGMAVCCAVDPLISALARLTRNSGRRSKRAVSRSVGAEHSVRVDVLYPAVSLLFKVAGPASG